MPLTTEFIASARSWIGTRWVHQGRTKMGIDCVGLAVIALGEIGVKVEDLKGYRRTAHPILFLEQIRKQTIPCESPEPGTIGVFRAGRTQPCHVAIFAEQDGVVTMIHADARVGKVLEERFDHEWPGNLIEIRKIEALTNG